MLNVLAGKEFKLGSKGSVLALNLKVTDVGGRYLTPLDLARSAQEGRSIYDERRAFSQKQDDYFRADLKIGYRKEFRKSTLELAVDFQNITGHQNIFSESYDKKTGKMVKNYQQGFSRCLYCSIRFKAGQVRCDRAGCCGLLCCFYRIIDFIVQSAWAIYWLRYFIARN